MTEINASDETVRIRLRSGSCLAVGVGESLGVPRRTYIVHPGEPKPDLALMSIELLQDIAGQLGLKDGD